MANPEPEERERVELLAQTSTQILDDVDRLRTLERKRRQAPISSPEYHRLEVEIEAASNDIFRGAAREASIAETLDTDATIDDVDNGKA